MLLDKKSPIPVYFQLKKIIKEDIEKRNLKPGDPLPSEREYCENFGISRMTVRQALKELESEGIIVRERGRGSFVAIPRIEQEGLMSFTEMVKARGMKPETEIVEFLKIPAGNLSATLGIKDEDNIFKITRARKADGIPVALETVYIPEEFVPDIEEKDLTGSLYNILKDEYGMEIKGSKTSFSATTSTPFLEELLKLEEPMPLLKVESVNFATGLIYYEVSYYRSDQFKITVNLSRG
ncbi:MAG: GntR family transcriptional regulator, N-acetylglucosamine utilization regulator [Thermoanaerobacteraceae bacterium]|nr:GntR family transcriptional regulator, N-acetylglucosamine utilization regulator [Thermoanaerobacteraceae bacterium]MDN5312277.1 GntR family transcriptional regulator, N-acetylglucosamine utilization regulator [Thermoanaerobacteraceae bacterium]RKL62127.1 GntR family transcriptional regulator [Thermoanaerobacteraceae bacterium SP2]